MGTFFLALPPPDFLAADFAAWICLDFPPALSGLPAAFLGGCVVVVVISKIEMGALNKKNKTKTNVCVCGSKIVPLLEEQLEEKGRERRCTQAKEKKYPQPP